MKFHLKILTFLLALIALSGLAITLVRNYHETKSIGFEKKKSQAQLEIYFKRNYATGIQILDSLIEENPENSNYHIFKGDAYVSLNDTLKAVEEFQTALKKGNRDSAQILLTLGLLFKQQDFNKAEKYFNTITAFIPTSYSNEHWAAYYHMGQIEFNKGNYSNAIRCYNSAMRFKETDLTLYHRANAYFAIGYIDSARTDYNNSIISVKSDFIRKYPDSKIAKCDTCGFPFGSREYAMLTEPDQELIDLALQTMQNSATHKKEIDTLISLRKGSR